MVENCGFLRGFFVFLFWFKFLGDFKNLSNFDLLRKWYVRCSVCVYGFFYEGCLYIIKLFVYKLSYIFFYIFLLVGKIC